MKPRYTPLLCLTLACTLPFSAIPADHAHGGSADTRHAISLNAAEKHFLLSEMREFLVVTQRILRASEAGDMADVARAARSVGLKAHRDDFANPASLVHGIRKKAPSAFFPLGKATHEAFDEIADVATAIGDRNAVNKLLADTLGNCVACHASYRIADSH